MRGRSQLGGALALVLCATQVALAFSAGDVDIHGFVSQGYMKSSDNNFLTSSDEGSFEFNEAALNVGSQLTDNLRVGLQVFSRDLGGIGNNAVDLDWAYLDYRRFDALGVRVGKIKLPYGLYNEIRDYDMLRTSILLPQSVYNLTWRETMVAVQGGSVYGNVAAGPVGGFEYQLYLGTSNIDKDGGVAKILEDTGRLDFEDATIKFLYGGTLQWATPAPGLLLGASAVRGDLDIETRPSAAFAQQLGFLFSTPPLSFLGLTVPSRIDVEIDNFWSSVFSAKYTLGGLTLAGEYARMQAHATLTGLPAVLGNNDTDYATEGWYLQAGYRFCPLFELGSYYSVYYPDRADKAGHDRETQGLDDFTAWQKDLAVSLRFDLNEWWLIKAEAHFLDGTGLLYQSDNPDGLDRKWQLYTVKTSVSF